MSGPARTPWPAANAPAASDRAARPARGYADLLEGSSPFDPAPLADAWQAPLGGTVLAPIAPVLAAIDRELDAIRRDPARRSRSLLVLGEKGAGKTHAFAHAIEAGLAARAHVVWVDRHDGEPDPFCALAARLAQDLGRRAPGLAASQLEALVRAAADPDPLPAAGAQGPDPARVRALATRLAAADPAIHRRLTHALLCAAAPGGGPGPRRLTAELATWIRGGLPSPQAGSWLGLKGAASSDLAFELLATAARLAIGALPLCVIVDHVERLAPRAAATGAPAAAPEAVALTAALCRLIDCVPNLLLVLACRTGAWHDGFAPRLNASERARLTLAQLEVGPLDRAGVEALVASRLDHHLGAAAPRPFATWPFAPELLDQVAPIAPGDLLELCRRELSAMRARGAIAVVGAPSTGASASGPARAALDQDLPPKVAEAAR